MDIDKKKECGKLMFTDIVMTLVGALVFSLIILFFFRRAVVDGASMNNTLRNGQNLILSRQSYALMGKTPEYKDIIVIEREGLSVQYLIKRVIGVAGDHLVIKNNQTYINDTLLDESYTNQDDLMDTSNLDVVIPEGKVFVMGDNRNHSIDSRSSIIGMIDETEIVGKIVGNR